MTPPRGGKIRERLPEESGPPTTYSPSTMNRLLIVHFSDIHLGGGIVGTRVASWGPNTGLNGHELLLCEKLERAVIQLSVRDFPLEAEERLHYVASGDLTRIGSDNDYYLSYTYLLGRWVEHRLAQRQTGLQIPVVDLYSVPGNHDHWNAYPGGLRPPAYNSAIFPGYFEPTPWRHTLRPASGAMALELFGVDSNEGLRNSKHNLRARGVLSANELKTLDALLYQSVVDEQKDGTPRIRAIVCHHAFTNQGGLLSAGPLDPQSVQDLLKLAHKYAVAAVLTGHTHYFESKDYPDPATGNVVWELRSASTTQMDPQPQPQGFWLHEIQLSGSRIGWNAWKYQWNGVSQFDRDPNAITVR
jgi:hypothetical protein